MLPEAPSAYAHKLDLIRNCALLIGFDEAAYKAASFLDDRVLTPATQGTWLSLDRVIEAADAVRSPRPLHFILHTGHVGSTLVSRLLDTTGTVLPLREPLPLRTLAEAADRLGQPESLVSPARFDALRNAFVRLWSRGFASTRTVVLKATSASSRIAPSLLQHEPASRAVYLNLRAEPYLATLLAGSNSPIDLRGHGPDRMRRLMQRCRSPLPHLHALSLGELAAMSWLAESMTQRDLLDQSPQQVLAVDFDVLLADVPRAMSQIAAHLELTVPDGWAEHLATSPALTRYSKSPDHDYSPALRAEILNQARHEHREEVRRGLDWLEKLARAEPGVARVLEATAA
jgi:hypothetical protein